MLDLAIDYAKKRSTFGKPIATRQAIQGNVAQMATEIQAARLLAYEAAWRFDQGLDMVKQASMAKLFSEQTVIRVAEMALRMHGGVGFTQAYPLERHFRDCRSFHFEEGTEEIQKLLIARYLLK
jgi:butyryl-CoA dehydrogenase